MKLIFYVLIAAFLTTEAFAQGGGTGVGNGGDVIYCESTQSYQLLDYWEASELFGREVYLGDESEDFKTLVRNALNRLWAIDPQRSERYMKRFSQFFSVARFLNHGDLREIDDSSEVALPAGCVLKQAVIQLREENALFYKFLIDRDIWIQLSEVDKAGLILHEIIYEEALNLENPHATSLPTRVLNGVISHRYFERDYKAITYFELLQKINFPLEILKFSNFCIIDPENNIEKISLIEFRFHNLQMATGSKYCSVGSHYRYEDQSLFVESAHVRLNVKGFTPISLTLAKSKSLRLSKGTIHIEGEISFHRNGLIADIVMRDEALIELQNKKRFIGQMNGLTKLSFWSNGSIKEAYLARNEFLLDANLLIKQVKVGEYSFTRDELLDL
jgi:hypothetical protein